MAGQRSVIVTGATSGIGRAVALAFVREGADVLAVGRDPARGREVADEAAEGRLEFFAADVTDPAACDAAVARAVARSGRLDVLVNAAGVIHVGNSEGTAPEDWRRVLSVNLDGAFYMCRAAMPLLRVRGGAIINIGSDYSLMAGPEAVAYCASKGGLLQMTKAMALDHARDGVRVNIVCPTVVDTPMIDDIATKKGTAPSELRRTYDAYVPTGRMVTADEVADAVLFLASDRARQITGIALPVDGGTTAMESMGYAAARAVRPDEIPTIDLGPLLAGAPEALEATAARIVAASRGLGFYYVVNHGIGPDTIARAFTASRAFFALPPERKAEIAVDEINRGWMAMGRARMTGAAKTDLKELFSWGLELGPDDPEVIAGTPFRGPNRWSVHVPGMRTAIYDGFWRQGCATAAALLRAVCVGLGLAPDALASHFEKPMARGQLIWYPPQPPEMGEDQFGVAAHTDFGCLTLVCQDDRGGLQVESRSGEWVAAPPVEGALLVNVGDLLARWSNGRFASTRHRVVNSSGRDRYSMAVFYDPSFHTVVDPRDLGLPPGEAPRFAPTTAGQHQLARFNAVFAHRLKGIDKAAAAGAPDRYEVSVPP